MAFTSRKLTPPKNIQSIHMQCQASAGPSWNGQRPRPNPSCGNVNTGLGGQDGRNVSTVLSHQKDLPMCPNAKAPMPMPKIYYTIFHSIWLYLFTTGRVSFILCSIFIMYIFGRELGFWAVVGDNTNYVPMVLCTASSALGAQANYAWHHHGCCFNVSRRA